MVENWPERIIPISIIKQFGFHENPDYPHGVWDGLIIPGCICKACEKQRGLVKK